MKLIIAEKPSVARTLASFLKCNKRHDGYFEGSDYIVTYAFGHLVTLFDMRDYDKEKYGGSWKFENFPFIPKDRFKFKVEDDKKKQFNIIKSLLERKDVDSVINATDNDREGELISFLILYQSKNKKPVNRILINEWTPEDIDHGMKNLKTDEEMRNLQAAGYTRLITDWLIGINFTSISTLKYSRGKILNIGRVILPTVKLIYDRDMEIRNFIPKIFFEVEARFLSKNGEYTGKLTFGDNETRFENIEDALNFISKFIDIDANNYIAKYNAVNSLTKGNVSNSKTSSIMVATNNKGVVSKVIKKKVKEHPPKLFSLTTLQGYISSRHSDFSADKVLKVCQSLYEGKGGGGFITYPRTDSNYLEDSLKDKASKTLAVLTMNHPLKSEISFSPTKRVFDSSKVESHSAIIPTYIIPTTLSRDEKVVYDAIRDRFLMAFMDPAEFENTEIITTVPPSDKTNQTKDINTSDGLKFVTKGKVLLKEGYLRLSGKKTTDNLLPKVRKNEAVDWTGISVKDGKTSPPKHYTEETILKAMKNCGQKVEDEEDVLPGYSIGTSATRAEVLKKILNVGYVKKVRKNYNITQLGENLVNIFPVKELFDVDYTGKLEKKLYDIQTGKYDRKEFLNDMCKFVYDNVNNIKYDTPKLISTEVVKFKPKNKKKATGKTSKKRT